jgi:putative RNA 2'-phosphotransferase
VQGHSDGAPVTREGLEASWEVVLADAPVVHGTTLTAAKVILQGEGLLSAARSHVHLAPSTDSVVGKRRDVQVFLVVSPPRLRSVGGVLWRAPNGVLLARAVPRSALIDVQPGTASEVELAPLRALLGLQGAGPSAL